MTTGEQVKTMQGKRTCFRYSLRALLGFVGLVAVSCAALFNASRTWLPIVSTATFAILMASVIVALFGAGHKRAFACGFALGSLAYLTFVYVAFRAENDSFGHIGTTTLLRYLEWSVAKQVPNPDLQRFPSAFSAPATIQVPDHDCFMHIGQQLCALVIGCLGGLLAYYVWSGRTAETRDKHPPNS